MTGGCRKPKYLYLSACMGLSVHTADRNSNRHRNPCRWKATEVLCHLFFPQFQAGAVLLFKQLHPWVPSSAGYTGKLQAADRPVGPPWSEPFIWHLMWKICPGLFQTGSIKFHTVQKLASEEYRFAAQRPYRHGEIQICGFHWLWGFIHSFQLLKSQGAKKLSCINQWP